MICRAACESRSDVFSRELHYGLFRVHGGGPHEDETATGNAQVASPQHFDAPSTQGAASPSAPGPPVLIPGGGGGVRRSKTRLLLRVRPRNQACLLRPVPKRASRPRPSIRLDPSRSAPSRHSAARREHGVTACARDLCGAGDDRRQRLGVLVRFGGPLCARLGTIFGGSSAAAKAPELGPPSLRSGERVLRALKDHGALFLGERSKG